MKNLKPTNRLANSLGCAVVLLAFQHAQAAPSAAPAANSVQKLRVIVTQDGEVDDRSSMVRFLMYSSDYDMVGIVAANSFFQKRGHGRAWIDKELDRYAEVLPNLKRHNPNFSDAAYLKSVIKIGNENSADLHTPPTDMATKNTAGFSSQTRP